MYTTYIGLGSNSGNRRRLLIAAAALMAERTGDIPILSAFFETEPWGYRSPHPYLNAALRLDTPLDPIQLLDATQQIERELGRTLKTDPATRRYTDRPIDIDILLFDRQIIDHPRLVVPHPLMHRRRFVLEPLAQIAPQALHPSLERNVSQLLAEIEAT